MSFVAERAGNTGAAIPASPLAGRRLRRHLRRLLTAIALCGAAAGLLACYLRLSATFPAGSDGASNALEAWDMLHGNWLLHGWTLTDVSFWPTELPEYAAVELARGLGPGVVHAAAAITYTLLVAAAAALARGRARGREGWARALITAGIMLAPQLGNGIHVLLSQPDHVGTQVPILGILLLLERAPRRRYTVAAVWALLTAATVADMITIVDAALPLAFAGALHAIWESSPRRRLRVRRFELSLALASVAAVGTAQALLVLIRWLGGFTLLPVNTATAAPSAGHLWLTWHSALTLFGANVTSATPGPQAVMAFLHAPGIALAIAALAIAAWRLPCPADLVSDVLAVAVIANLAGFVASVIPATPFDTREMAAVLPFGAVLAGRLFGPLLFRPWFTGTRLARPAMAALAAGGLCQLIALGYGATRAPAAGPEQALADWLVAHHLSSGLGTFSEDNVTTLDSRGRVRMLTVSWHDHPGGTVPRLYQSSAAWYDPGSGYANFVVSGTANGPADLIPRAEILRLAGPPARSCQVGPFRVMVWNKNLLALLGGPPSAKPGIIGHS